MTSQTKFIIDTGENYQQYKGVYDEISEKEILINFKNFHDGKNNIIV